MRSAWLLAILLTFSLAACGDTNDTDLDGSGGGTGGAGGTGGTGGSGGSGGTGGTGPEVVPAVWGECPEGPGACTTIDVPLDWGAPEESETLPFFVRRIPAKEQPARGQLWLLQGGPGSAGWMFTSVASDFQRIAPGYDLLIPDYRGTGYSTWLGCTFEDGGGLSGFCLSRLQARWGDGLRHFSTTATVRDINHAIEAIRRPDDRVLLYGVSYGTFVLNRFLTLFPEQADGALLDSVCPASGCDVRMDQNANLVAAHVFDLCGADTFCASKLGADPWARLLELFDDLEAGHCSDFLGYPANRDALAEITLYMALDPMTLPVSLATIYRADRCSPEDVVALQHLVDSLSSPSGFATFEGDENSMYHSLQIVFAEFWPEGLERAQVEAELAELPLEMGTLRQWMEIRDVWPWPIVPTPVAEKRWADTETPLLLLNGDLDMQTHLNGLHDVAASFNNAAQQFVQVPLAGHGVFFSSAALPEEPSITCGMALARSFFAEPTAALDTSCTGEVPPLRFTGSSRMSRWLLGTDDMWENGGSTALAIPAPLTPAEEKAIEALQRRLREMPRF